MPRWGRCTDYIMKLSGGTQQEPRWQIAVEHLINAAGRGAGTAT
ncbi:MAG TPA: hypothetical protein VF583_10890 [Bradyrhizobium sp.]